MTWLIRIGGSGRLESSQQQTGVASINIRCLYVQGPNSLYWGWSSALNSKSENPYNGLKDGQKFLEFQNPSHPPQKNQLASAEPRASCNPFTRHLVGKMTI